MIVRIINDGFVYTPNPPQFTIVIIIHNKVEHIQPRSWVIPTKLSFFNKWYIEYIHQSFLNNYNTTYEGRS